MPDRRQILFAVAAALIPARADAGLPRSSALAHATRSYGPASLDIFAPANAENRPVVFYVHGGGWRRGSRKLVDTKPEHFTALGFVFVSIDYRLLPEAQVATQALDVEAAFAWVRGNIVGHGGDPRRIVALGHSAGAHLVALTGLRGGLSGVRGLLLDDVEAYDIAAMAADGRMRRVYGDAFNDPSQWEALSPIKYADKPGRPPSMILWSRVRDHDAAAKNLAAALEKAGNRVTLFDGSAYSHKEMNARIGVAGDPLTVAVDAFIAAAIGG